MRREREMRGISLEEIVASTKIGKRLLLALEEEQFDLLPGGIFNKAYVRAYAKCVGIDEDEAVAAYLAAANESPPDARVIAQQHASIHSSQPVPRSGFPIMPVLILLAVAAGGIGGWKLYQQHQGMQAKQAAAATPAEPSPQSPSVASSSTSSAQGEQGEALSTPLQQSSSAAPAESQAAFSAAAVPPGKTLHAQETPAEPTRAMPAETFANAPAETSANAPAGPPFEITVRPKDSAWVSIKSDGRYVVRGIIRPPEVKTIHATDQVVFYTGNAGAVDVSFNGKNVPVPGGPNQEQVLVFSSRGVVPIAHTPVAHAPAGDSSGTHSPGTHATTGEP
ncbi:MAG TPA: RodZ domain-containing protein [Terriglobales bacterium]|nr:RodZ domain-containing protein [Terriglobales bacterium]